MIKAEVKSSTGEQARRRSGRLLRDSGEVQKVVKRPQPKVTNMEVNEIATRKRRRGTAAVAVDSEVETKRSKEEESNDSVIEEKEEEKETEQKPSKYGE